MVKKKYKYKAFISYAGEDRENIAKPIAERLSSIGVKVWFDEFEMKVGDSLSDKISTGLQESEYGVCIISPAFIKKKWPRWELKGLINLLLQNHSKILPVWYKVSQKDVIKLNPSIADIKAVKTDGKDVSIASLTLLKTIAPELYDSFLRIQIFIHLRDKNTKLVKVPLQNLRPGPIQHKVLPEHALIRAALYSKVLEEVGLNYFTTLDSLQRDIDLEREIEIMEFIALVYYEITHKNKLTIFAKRELFMYLIIFSTGVNEWTQDAKKDIKHLTPQLFEKARKMYDEGISGTFDFIKKRKKA